MEDDDEEDGFGVVLFIIEVVGGRWAFIGLFIIDYSNSDNRYHVICSSDRTGQIILDRTTRTGL